MAGSGSHIKAVWLEYQEEKPFCSLISGRVIDRKLHRKNVLAEKLELCLEPKVEFIDGDHYLVILAVGPEYKFQYRVCRTGDDTVVMTGVLGEDNCKCGAFDLVRSPDGCVIVWESWNNDAVAELKSCRIDKTGQPGTINSLTPPGLSAYWPSAVWHDDHLLVAFSTPDGETEFDCMLLQANNEIKYWKLNTSQTAEYSLYPEITLDREKQLWVTWLQETEQEFYHLIGQMADSTYCCLQDEESRRKRKILWNATEPKVMKLEIDADRITASAYHPSGKPRGDLENQTVHYPSLVFTEDNQPVMIFDHSHLHKRKRFEMMYCQLGLFDNRQLEKPVCNSSQLALPTKSRTIVNDNVLFMIQEVFNSATETRSDPEMELELHSYELDLPKIDLSPCSIQEFDVIKPFNPQKSICKSGAYFGNIHIHTEFSVCRRDTQQSLDFNYRWSLASMNQDFTVITDHEQDISHGHWLYCISMAEFFNFPERHVTLPAYEWALRYPNGHMNVYFFDNIAPLSGHPHESATNLDELWEKLDGLRALTIAHHTGTSPMHRDWDKFNPEREPVVEIYQDRRGNYEYFDAPQHPGAGCPEQGIEARTSSGFVVEALRRGYKPGFCSGGDHMGLSMTGTNIPRLNREELYQAFTSRNCFGVSRPGVEIAIDASSGNKQAQMGKTLPVNELPLKIRVTAKSGTAIASVVLIHDGAEYLREKVDSPSFEKIFEINEKVDYLYARVELSDGNLAWSSPIWLE